MGGSKFELETNYSDDIEVAKQREQFKKQNN